MMMVFAGVTLAPVHHQPPESVIPAQVGLSPPAYYERTLDRLNFRVPERYFDLGLGLSGFRLRFALSDLVSERRAGGSSAGTHVDVWVRYDGPRPLSVEASLALYIQMRALGRAHLPSVLAESIEEPDAPGVPSDLIYFRALPSNFPASGVKEDVFLPRRYRFEQIERFEVEEAVFCLSGVSRTVAMGGGFGGRRPCDALLPYRGVRLRIDFDRSLITSYAEMKQSVVRMLDSFVDNGPSP